MDTTTYAVAAAVLQSVIQWLKRPFVPEAEFLPFNMSEMARLSYRHYERTLEGRDSGCPKMVSLSLLFFAVIISFCTGQFIRGLLISLWT